VKLLGTPKSRVRILTLGAACCGFLAAAITTLVFLWSYGFTFYGESFFGRRLPVLSTGSKFLLFTLAFLVWFIIFLKWVFKPTNRLKEFRSFRQDGEMS